MGNILQFIKTLEIWIYLLLGLVGVVYLRKFVVALNQWRGSYFGIERDIAQRQLNGAASALVLILLMLVGTFMVSTFLLPTLPALGVLPTPTLDVLATPTITLEPGAAAAATAQPRPTSTNAPVNLSQNGCIKGQFELTEPEAGQEISGVVELKGTIKVSNFGFYKYEYALPGSSDWVTIAAGSTIDPEGSLGFWETSALSPGDYLLRIVVTDNAGNELPACFTQVRVAQP